VYKAGGKKTNPANGIVPTMEAQQRWEKKERPLGQETKLSQQF
jgi:hypothetical protein